MDAATGAFLDDLLVAAAALRGEWAAGRAALRNRPAGAAELRALLRSWE